jgi:multicomponent Na+:H+ antiporter subunit E
MRRTALTITWLTLVWMALWEDFSWANLAGGILAGSLATFLIPSHPPEVSHGFRPIAFLRLVGHFVKKLVEATAVLAWEVLTPRDHINAAVIAVPLTTRSPRIASLVANMDSLTPGTLTLEVIEETMTLVVHVLHLESVEAGREELLHLERLAMAAFPERTPRGGI